MTSLCKTYVPQYIYDALEPIKDDDLAVKDFGVNLAIEMCNKMRENGQRGFHFYTLNLERSTRNILEGLGFVAARESVKKLPWNPSLAPSRERENVRPIFWQNRPRSYISRTTGWEADEFPNGRWGDSRSPAYGELDGYGASLKYPAEECLKLWNHPATIADLADLFVQFCKGQLSSLPWSDSPLIAESAVIQANLVKANSECFLTINSQPAVDGAPSSHPVYGWGPKNGFVFQKSYLEFFISSDALAILIPLLMKDSFLTFYAVNDQGDFKTNTKGDSPNAVTFGVFPGQEIMQPTIVEGIILF